MIIYRNEKLKSLFCFGLFKWQIIGIIKTTFIKKKKKNTYKILNINGRYWCWKITMVSPLLSLASPIVFVALYTRLLYNCHCSIDRCRRQKDENPYTYNVHESFSFFQLFLLISFELSRYTYNLVSEFLNKKTDESFLFENK